MPINMDMYMGWQCGHLDQPVQQLGWGGTNLPVTQLQQAAQAAWPFKQGGALQYHGCCDTHDQLEKVGQAVGGVCVWIPAPSS